MDPDSYPVELQRRKCASTFHEKNFICFDNMPHTYVSFLKKQTNKKLNQLLSVTYDQIRLLKEHSIKETISLKELYNDDYTIFTKFVNGVLKINMLSV